jgi:ribonuclease D
VESADALSSLVERIAREPRIALDTEANSLHAFRERVCVVQLSVPGIDAIIDPLAVPDLDPLRRLVDRDDVEIVFHGGDYDVSVLSRDHGFGFRRVFDTMIAATFLGEAQLGLLALVEKEFGVRLEKKYQTADWARRPFSSEQIDYLRGDTRHLLELSSRLKDRIAATDLVEETDIEFVRLAARRGAPWADVPDGWRKAKGAEKLDERGRAILASTWAWREEQARRHDVPRFRVVPNETLTELAARPPADLAELSRRPGIGSVVRMGDGPALFDAVLAGVAAFERGEAPKAAEKPRLSAEERAAADVRRRREERIRRWRTDEAIRRRVVNAVVLPNPGMEALIDALPTTIEEIAALRDVGAKRAQAYGAKFLELLAAPPPTA